MHSRFLHHARSTVRLSAALALLGTLTACSTFYDTHSTPAAAALASTRQQLAQTSYQIHTVAKVEDAQASPSVSDSFDKLMDSDDMEVLGSASDKASARAAVEAAKVALAAVTGQKPSAADLAQQDAADAAGAAADAAAAAAAGQASSKAIKTPKAGKPVQPASDNGSVWAGIAADNRNHKGGSVFSSLGRGYLDLLRGMQTFSDLAVDGAAGRVAYVSGLRYNSRNTQYASRTPMLLDLKGQTLYWDAEQLSYVMNPVTRDRPVRIDLQPLFETADVVKLYGILRAQQAHALQHADPAKFAYVDIQPEDGDVGSAYRKIRYQQSLREVLLQSRDYLKVQQGDIAATFHKEATRKSVHDVIGLLVEAGKALEPKATPAASPVAYSPMAAEAAAAAAETSVHVGAVASEGKNALAAAETAAVPGRAAPTSAFEQMIDQSLDKSIIQATLWLDRAGKLLRQDNVYDLHLGDAKDWVKLKMVAQQRYDALRTAPQTLSGIQPEQAVDLRTAVKGSLAGSVLALVYDLTNKPKADKD